MENKIYLLCIWNEDKVEEILAFHSLEKALDRGWEILIQTDNTLGEEFKNFWYEYHDIDCFMYIYDTEFED